MSIPSTMPTFPGIPAIQNEKTLLPVVAALKECVELLTGATGNGRLKAASTDIQRQLDEINRRLAAAGIP